MYLFTKLSFYTGQILSFFSRHLVCTLTKKLKLVASTKWKIALVETALRLTHANDQMLGIYQVIKQMEVKTTAYDIVNSSLVLLVLSSLVSMILSLAHAEPELTA